MEFSPANPVDQAEPKEVPTPEPEALPVAPSAPRIRPPNPYIVHQTSLMFEAFSRDNPGLLGENPTPEQRDAVGLWWVGKGYAAAFSHAAKMLRETGQDRLPEIDDIELDSEEEEPWTMELARKRLGRPLA